MCYYSIFINKKEHAMWKKIMIPMMVLGAVSATAGSYDLEANPSKIFVGVQAGESWVQGTHKADNDYKTAGIAYGLRLGAQNYEWRSMVTLDYMNNKKVGYLRGEIHTDYLFHFNSDAAGVGIVPFLGLNGGYAS
jgi:hypothetical protein